MQNTHNVKHSRSELWLWPGVQTGMDRHPKVQDHWTLRAMKRPQYPLEINLRDCRYCNRELGIITPTSLDSRLISLTTFQSFRTNLIHRSHLWVSLLKLDYNSWTARWTAITTLLPNSDAMYMTSFFKLSSFSLLIQCTVRPRRTSYFRPDTLPPKKNEIQSIWEGRGGSW